MTQKKPTSHIFRKEKEDLCNFRLGSLTAVLGKTVKQTLLEKIVSFLRTGKMIR